MLKVVFLLCLLLFSVAGSASASAVMFDRIVAIVNEDIITQSELDRYIMLASLGVEAPRLDRASTYKMLEQLVERKIFEQEAKRTDVTVRERDIDQTLQELASRNNISFREFVAQIEDTGVTIEELRSAIRSELKTSELIGREVHAKISITDAEMERYYEANIKPKERFGARVRLQQILLRVNRNFTEEQIDRMRTQAEFLRAQLDSGADFEELAFTYSQCPGAERGGDIGFFYKGQMISEIEQVAFSIPELTVSPVISTPVGFHIIMVTARDDVDSDRSWKSHDREIRSVLYNRAFEKAYTRWYTDLRSRSHVEFRF